MVSGTAIYKNGSKGGFSFNDWETLIKMSNEENLREIRLFMPIKELDCEIRDFKKEFEDDYTKEESGFYFRCNVGFCESLGEQGFIYTFFYDKIPTEEQLKEDIKKYIKEEIKELNGKLLGGYEENHLRALKKVKI